ncbi:MAG: hypothetical protein CSB15_00280 [Clostridiales bacterium]|nr:MAG: hypothetical protein CSB15_00280 [Clostridiales bacterium]
MKKDTRNIDDNKNKTYLYLKCGIALSAFSFIVIMIISFFKDIEITSAKIVFGFMIIGVITSEIIVNRKQNSKVKKFF